MRTLEQWESELRLQLEPTQVQLVGEIDLDATWIEELGGLIGRRYNHIGPTRGLEVLTEHTPYAFVTLLVVNGVFNYSERKVWPSLSKAIGKELSAVEQSDWGRAFQTCLERLGKPSFPHVGGRRYVTRMLLHGGIPNSSLNDYFETFVLPAAQRAEALDLDRKDALDAALSRSRNSAADAPIERFLRYGGPIAIDFFDRSCKLARTYLENGKLLGADDVGLPKRVVEKYQAWAIGRARVRSRQGTVGLRLRRPRLVLDPWGIGVAIRFPSQTLPGSLDPDRLELRICAGAEADQLIQIRFYFQGRDLVTEEPQPIPVTSSAPAYHVTLLIDGKEERAWSLAGPDDLRPILIFDPDTQEVVDAERYLLGRIYWVLYPTDCQLAVSDFALLPSLLGWDHHQLAEVDLTNSSSLEVTRPEETLRLSVVATASTLVPRLLSDPFGAVYTLGDGVPVYAGMAPSVQIPILPHQPDYLQGWRMRVRSIGSAWPKVDQSFRLDGGLPSLERDGDGGRVHLAHASILGPAACGTFQVELKGPLGHDARWIFRLWPELDIRGIDNVFVPSPEGLVKPVSIDLATGSMDIVSCPEAPNQLHRLSDGRWSVSFQPLSSRRRLELTRKLGDVDALIQLPIEVNRLHWTIVDEADAPTQRALLNRPARLSLDELAQMTRPALVVWLSRPRSLPPKTELALEVRDRQGREVAAQVRQPGGVRTKWRFSLLNLMDGLRTSREPWAKATVNTAPLYGKADGEQVTLAVVTRQWRPNGVGIGAVSMSAGSKADKSLEIRWEEVGQPLKGRHVRLWNVWQPWVAPVEIPIADDARGRLLVAPRTSRELLPGHPGCLALEFFVPDPWLPAKKQLQIRPEDTLPTIVLTNPEERRAALIQLAISQPQEKFRCLLEQFFICVQQGDLATAERPANGCLKNLDCADLDEQLILFDGLVRADMPSHAVEVAKYLYSASVAKTLIDRAERHDLDREQVRQYVLNKPDHLTWPPDVWSMVRRLERPDLTEVAVKHLARLKDPRAVETCLSELHLERMSLKKATALLADSWEYALSILEPQAADPTALQLMAALGRGKVERAFVVEPGHWVKTSAGWGRILSIADWDGTPLPHMSYLDRERMLTIRLRPDYGDEIVIYDYLNDVVRFEKEGDVYFCTKCKACASRHQKDILETHDRVAHKRELLSSGGVSRQDGSALPLGTKILTFLTTEPKDVWN